MTPAKDLMFDETYMWLKTLNAFLIGAFEFLQYSAVCGFECRSEHA